jgi:hypothetical protein
MAKGEKREKRRSVPIPDLRDRKATNPCGLEEVLSRE